MGSTSSQPESQPAAESQPRDSWKPISLCGTLHTMVVPAEHYVEQLWATLEKTLSHSKCGIGSDTPVGKGGTLDIETLSIVGADAPPKPFIPAPGVPPPPQYLPEMKDEQIVKNTIKALSPRIACYLTGLTMPNPEEYWRNNCVREKTNCKMHYHDRTVGYVIAKESSRDSSTKLLY